MSLKQAIIDQARAEGFSLCRFTHPDSISHVPDKLSDFIDAGYHGQMSWMADRQTWRANPRALWPDAQTIIMLGESYAPEHDPTDILKHLEKGAISVYAQNKDYHDLVKKRLKRLARWLIAHSGGEVKVFVDTAPVSEKPLGQAAGLGWQGKHTNLVSRDLGNWFFIGSVFTTLSIEPDVAEVDHCGSCQSCIKACPTDAFPAPYQLDARRCISYLTIEHSGPVDVDLRGLMGNRIYGCDDCLAACPWNKFAAAASEMKLRARDDLNAPELAELSKLDDRAFREMFRGSPIKRIGRSRFIRNVLYAIGNSGLPKLEDAARAHTDHPDDVVRDAARWAVGRLRS